MPAQILCPNPNCGATYSVVNETLGNLDRCKKCGTKFPFVPGIRNGSSPTASETDVNSAPKSPEPSSPEPSLPDSFGRYQIVRLLGRGGMGSVYLALDPQLRRQVALKVPHINGFADRPEIRVRFLREAEAAARFHHPNFCPIHDIGEADGIPFLTMAFIDGRTLSASIEWGNGWEPRRAAEVARQLAVALAELHRQGIVHRDLKPANIMVDARGGLVLMDFGLARWYDDLGSSFTPAGTILGTPAYMPPEQAEGNLKAIGPRSDLYSLGVILYELLTGRRPFEGPITKVLGMIALAEPPSPSSHCLDLDPRLESICLKAMAKKPDDRYASMDEFAGALTAFLSEEVAPSPVIPPRPAENSSDQDFEEAPAWEPSPFSDAKPPVMPGLEVSEGRSAYPLSWPRSPRLNRAATVVFALSSLTSLFLAYGWFHEAPLEREETLRTATLEREETLRREAERRIATAKKQSDYEKGRLEKELDRTRTTAEPKKAEPSRVNIPEPPSLSAPPTFGVNPITNALGMKLKLIPAGEFAMGSDASDLDAIDDEKVDGKKHQVRITRPFYLGTTEVTVGQFRKFVQAIGYKTEAEKDGKGGHGWNEVNARFEQDPKYTWHSPSFPQTDEHPVVLVSWNDAVAFCDWLSQQEGKSYRLPTEAEWEYACRAGRTTRYYSGDGPESLARVGNVADGTLKGKYPAWPLPTLKAKDGYVFTAPVGRFDPNAFGLYDMQGNVYEWCADWYGPDYYSKSPPIDPVNSSVSTVRVVRGGSWIVPAHAARLACRNKRLPESRYDFLGFRVARVQ